MPEAYQALQVNFHWQTDRQTDRQTDQNTDRPIVWGNKVQSGKCHVSRLYFVTPVIDYMRFIQSHSPYLRISIHSSHTSPNSNHVHQRGEENIGARRVKGGGSPVDSDWDVSSAHKHGVGALNSEIEVGREAVLGCKSTCMHEDGRWEERGGGGWDISWVAKWVLTMIVTLLMNAGHCKSDLEL